MAFIAILILLLLLALNVKLDPRLLAPAVVTNLVWLILLIIYNCVDHGLYALSDHFYGIVILWNVGFSISAYVGSNIKFKVPKAMLGLNRKSTSNIWLVVMIICLCMIIIGLYKIGSAVNPDNVFSGVRQNSVNVLHGEEPEIQLPIYIRVAQIIGTYAIIVIGTILIIRGDKRLIVKCAVLLLVMATLMRSNKSVMAQLLFFFVSLTVLVNGISRKKIFGFLSVAIILMGLAHLLRQSSGSSQEFDLGRMLAVYLLSPMPAFDYVSTAPITLIEDFNGEYTFRAFISYINLLGFNLVGNRDPFNLLFWTNTPLPTNVYTIFFSPYTDFGIAGIIGASIIYGLFFGLLWNGCKKNIAVFKVSYASMFYVIAFQFFTDFLFTFFWVNALNIAFTFFFFTRFSVGDNIKRNHYDVIHA